MDEWPMSVDARADFWRRHFDQTRDLEAYLAGADPAKAKKWRDMAAKLPPVSDEIRARLSGHNRPMNVMVYTGIWCGDCARQGPMLVQLAEACGPDVRVHFIERETSSALTEELRILGGMRVPVAVFLSEEFNEVGRYGDRTLTAYRAKAARELGAACDTGLVAPPTDQLVAETEEWADVFERMLLMLRLAPALREKHGD